jgi:hypothetical protein
MSVHAVQFVVAEGARAFRPPFGGGCWEALFWQRFTRECSIHLTVLLIAQMPAQPLAVAAAVASRESVESALLAVVGRIQLQKLA